MLRTDDILQDDNIPTLLDWDRITKDIQEHANKNPIKNIDEKGSILLYLKSSLMIIPLKLRKAFKGLSSGAVLVAMPTTILRLAGFSIWMISNTLWVIQA